VALVVSCDSAPAPFILRPQRDKVDMEVGDITTKRREKNVFRRGIVALSDCFSDLVQSLVKPRKDAFVHFPGAVPFTRLSRENGVALCVRGSRGKSKPPISFVENTVWQASISIAEITSRHIFLLKSLTIEVWDGCKPLEEIVIKNLFKWFS
jgi:hypothetical protein